jgi:hypothetical protein
MPMQIQLKCVLKETEKNLKEHHFFRVPGLDFDLTLNKGCGLIAIIFGTCTPK